MPPAACGPARACAPTTPDAGPAGGAPAPASRLFLALWPGAPVRRALAAWRDAFAWPPGAAPVADARLHLTLHFIGEVASDRLPALEQALRVPVPCFDLQLDQARCWRGGLVVLQPAAPPAALVAWHRALGDALRAAGLPPEARAFRPHVTLARRAGAARAGPAPTAVRWPVRSYALVRSTLTAPARYELLWRQAALPGTARERSDRPRAPP